MQPPPIPWVGVEGWGNEEEAQRLLYPGAKTKFLGIFRQVLRKGALTFVFVPTLQVDRFKDPLQGPRYPASEALQGRNLAEQIGNVDSSFLCTFWQQLKQFCA